MSSDNEKKRKEALEKNNPPIEFLKPKLKEDKNKENKMEKTPSPHAPIVPCIKCGKTHRKGAKCKP